MNTKIVQDPLRSWTI